MKATQDHTKLSDLAYLEHDPGLDRIFIYYNNIKYVVLFRIEIHV